MTELSWEGKYLNGKKTAPVRLALPFQTIETVNESVQQRAHTLDLFATGKATQWRNRLIWGDKKYVLPSLLPELAGKVNLIYIDPPFDTGANFSFTAQIPQDPDDDNPESLSFTKQPSIIEQKAYRDTWGRGLDSYLQWFYETALLLRELLAEDGSIYVHLDWHVSHYAKAVLDEIFGYENFLNEIIWKRTFNSGSSKTLSKKYPANTDTIFFYKKSNKYTFNKQFIDLSDGAIRRYDKIDEQGRRFKWNPMKTYSQAKLERLMAEGEAKIIPTSKYPIYKHYYDEDKGRAIENLWDDLAPIGTFSDERVDYNTQKPEVLLERILKASSNEGDLVLDCFCGSGTTAAVAEKLNRRWITCDLGRFAIHTARKRLLGVAGVQPFVVQNLGKYERQQWMRAEFENPTGRLAQETAYRNFILDLYRAQPLAGYTWLHGVRAGKMIHVGSVDAPISEGDIKQIVMEFWKTAGRKTGSAAAENSILPEAQTPASGAGPLFNEIHVLGWDFAFEINEVAIHYARQHNIDIKPKKIPREVLEKKAVEQGDIKFFELAYLDIATAVKGRKLTLSLQNFIVPPDDLPPELAGKITHWSQWIDYWAVDWNHRNDTFHNEWQSYRTKKDPKLTLKTDVVYENPGSYTVVVKVIDILGNDTTKAVQVQV